MFDTIRIGNCTLYLGQCEDILPTLGKVDAIVTDPPYKFHNSGGGKFRKARQASNLIQSTKMSKGFEFNDVNWKTADSVVVFCHNDQVVDIMGKLQDLFHRVALCSYHKTNPSPMANKHYLADTEFYIHAWQKGAHPIGAHTDLRRYFVGSRQNHKFKHPTVKPLSLMEKIVTNVQGQTICDPYMGTGTTGLACISHGRDFIGIEREPKYFDIACKRIEEALAQEDRFKATLPNVQPFKKFGDLAAKIVSKAHNYET